MNETDYKQEGQKGEKVKRRTSLKNIIGGDILATDFFRRQTQTACSHHGSYSVLHPQPLCLSATNDRDRQTQERTDRY